MVFHKQLTNTPQLKAGCENVCEKNSAKVWNNLKCLKRCAFQCIKSLKMGFNEEQNVWNQIKNLNSHILLRIPASESSIVTLPWLSSSWGRPWRCWSQACCARCCHTHTPCHRWWGRRSPLSQHKRSWSPSCLGRSPAQGKLHK